MSSAAVSSSTAAVKSTDKKRKEPSEAEAAQAALLESLFNAKNSDVITRANAALGEPAPKKVKVEKKPSDGWEGDSVMATPVNPFVAAMDAGPKQMMAKPIARTQNGAASLTTTMAPNLDLFYHLCRGYSAADINASLPHCWNENPETMLKVLCHARDCHKSGKGERLIVYHALMWLRVNKPRTYLANLLTFLSHGYFKDLLNLVEMIDGKTLAGETFVPQPKVGKSGKKKGAKSIGASITNAANAKKAAQMAAASSAHSSSKSKPQQGEIGGSNFELNLLAEYLKADFIKLKAWRNAKKAYAAQQKKAATDAEDALMAEKAKAGRKELKSYSIVKTAWFDEEADVIEAGEIEDEEEWTEVAETATRVEKLEIKEQYMADVPVDETAVSSSASLATSSTSAPASLVAPPANCFISLAGKYAPSERHHFASQAKRLAKILFAGEQANKSSGFMNAKHMQSCLKKYRELLSTLRAHLCITERLACENRWSAINFNAVPSKCHQLLKKAFIRHCGAKYQSYLAGLKKGVGKINVTGTAPHELVGYYLKGGALNETVEAAWKALVAKTAEAGTFKGAVSIVDVSGSMSGQPMMVAIALGLLVAELCEGAYRGRVITFHEQPSWHTIEGETLQAKVACLAKAPWGGSTNLQASFEMILDVAKKHKIAQEHLPTNLFIFSDMQFDTAVSAGGSAKNGWMATNYAVVKKKFTSAGYSMMNIVFWNLNGALNKDCPVDCTTAGCALMSGFSAQLLNVFLRAPVADEAEDASSSMTDANAPEANPLHPLRIMMDSIKEYEVEVVESER